MWQGLDKCADALQINTIICCRIKLLKNYSRSSKCPEELATEIRDVMILFLRYLCEREREGGDLDKVQNYISDVYNC